MALTANYEIVSCDLNGNNRWTHNHAIGTAPVRLELDGNGSFSFEVPATDPGYLSGKLDPIVREVQVWRGTQKLWWGVITNTDVNDLKAVSVRCDGLLWYFSRRVVGSAGVNNVLNNGSFDSGALPNWTAHGVTADIVTQWGYRPGSTYQLNLYQGGSGTDTFVDQNITVPGGQYWTLSGWFHIRQDAEWAGPALDGRGLYVERRHPTTNVVEDLQFFAITDDTPRGVFQRATVNIWSPPGRTSVMNVRLYATRCINPTPSGGRPPGGIIWDQIKFVAEESLSFPYRDMGLIINSLVSHAQDPAFGKTGLNIAGAAPTTGVNIDRTYMYVEHREILDALREFQQLGLCDIGIEYDEASNNRWLACYVPKGGSTRTDIALEINSKSTLREVPSIEGDGTKVRTTVIAQGEGSGPDREQGEHSDTSGTGGIVLEEVFQPSDLATPSFDLLPGLAQQRVAENGKVVKVPKLIVSPEMHGRIGLGDTVKVIVPNIGIDGWYRIVSMEIDTKTDMIALEVNPSAA